MSQIVFECNRKVCRVGDNDVGGRDFGHHSTFGHFSLGVANSCFNVRITFGLFVFVLDLLAGHFRLRL